MVNGSPRCEVLTCVPATAIVPAQVLMAPRIGAAKDRCVQGACTGIPVACTNGDVCNPEVCDPVKGCQQSDPGEVPCSDGNPCTVGDLCGLGSCVPGIANKCACSIDADCAPWQDGNLCNGSLKCDSGACVLDPASVPLPCDNTANTDTTCMINACVPATGLCALKLTNNGAACSDGSACTVGDLCGTLLSR